MLLAGHCCTLHLEYSHQRPPREVFAPPSRELGMVLLPPVGHRHTVRRIQSIKSFLSYGAFLRNFPLMRAYSESPLFFFLILWVLIAASLVKLLTATFVWGCSSPWMRLILCTPTSNNTI